MRLTLSLADFSGAGKNIGTLNSWFISKNTPSGLTWTTAPNSVDKGADFNAVAEIDTANYELVTMTVTMGTTTQTGVGTSGGIRISNSGSQYTIYISSVTANVNISVTTKNLSTELPDSGGSGGGSTTYTFTVNPTPSTATVTLSASGYTTVSGTGSKSISVASGTVVSYNVSASGYTSQSGTQTVTSTSTKNISLSESSSSSGTTVKLFNANRTIVNSIADMSFTAKLALSATSALTNVAGRASDHTHALAATAGQTVTLSQPISGVTLTYALVCFNSSGKTCSKDKNFLAQAWLSSSVTLPTDTAYVMIAFKRGNGSSGDFSSSELTQLTSALTFA